MKIDVVDIGFQHVGRRLEDFLPDGDRRFVDGVAADDCGPACKGGYAPVERLGVAFDHDHVLGLHAKLVGDDLGEHRVVALALGRESGVDIDLAGDRMHADMAALVGPEPGAFDIAGEPEAEIFARSACGVLFGAKFLAAKLDQRHAERLGVLAAVEGDLQPVGEQQAFARVREFLFRNEIAPPDFEAVDAQILRQLIERSFGGEAGLRPPAAAIRGDLDGRRIDRLELHPDIRNSVRPGDRGRGNLSDRDAVRNERAGVVQEAVAQTDDLAGLQRCELDDVDLGPLLRRAR